MCDGQEFGGEWTKKKLEILRKYLEAYRTIFTRNEKARKLRSWYVDAFAGAGSWRPRDCSESGSAEGDLLDGETMEFFMGSPFVALELSSPFDRYRFIEQDERTNKELEKRLEERYGGKYKDKDRVKILPGDANTNLKAFAEELEDLDRAVVFLDPFGLSVKWETVEILAQTQKIDLWYWFNISAVHRLLPREGEPGESWASKLTEIFGTEKWKNLFYSSEEDLFRDDHVSKTVNTKGIACFLIQRLQETDFGRDGVCPKAGLFKNSKNAPLFVLCFAASNPKGKKTAVKIAGDLLKISNEVIYTQNEAG